MKYRKKPILVEAYQTDKELDIETLEGVMHANIGDYIITGVNGETYPCKPEIFEKTYRKATTDKERIIDYINRFVPDDFRYRYISLTFTNDNEAIISLSNDE